MSLKFFNMYLILKDKVYTINFPISGNLPLKTINSETVNKKQIITSLSKKKGHERILKVISKINFHFQYTIVGIGNEKDKIFQLANDLDLFENLIYIFHTNDVATILAKSDVFFQGSIVQGIPKSVLESCFVGTPVIALKGPGGIKEIIENGINVYTVQDESEFIQKTTDLLFQEEWNHINVKNSVVEKFNKDHILGQYEQLFIKIATS